MSIPSVSGWGFSAPDWGAFHQQNRQEQEYADQAHNWSAEAALQQQNFQERMSNTAWERGVRDMKNAGINPMLAASQGGASSPAGAGFAGAQGKTPQMSHVNAQVQMQTAAQVRNLDADSNLKNAQADEIPHTARMAREESGHRMAEIRQKIGQSAMEIERIIAATTHEEASAANMRQQTENLRTLIPNLQETLRLLKTQTGEGQQRLRQNLPGLEANVKKLQAIFMELEKPGRQQTGDFQASGAGQVLKSIGNALRELNPLLPSTTIHSR